MICWNCGSFVGYCRGCDFECPYCGADVRLDKSKPLPPPDFIQSNCTENKDAIGPWKEEGDWPFPWIKGGKAIKRESDE